MRLESLLQTQTVQIAGLSDLLAKIAVGDIVRARILEISSGEALLKLFDGTELKALLPSDLHIEEGNTVDFKVTAKNDSQVFLETIKNQATNNKIDIQNLLAKLSIEANEKNLEIAKELDANGITLSRQAFDKVHELLKNNPELNAEKAVFFYKNNFVPKDNDITSLSRLMEGKMKLSAALQDLYDEIVRSADLHTLEKLSNILGKQIPVPKNNVEILPQDQKTPELSASKEQSSIDSLKITDIDKNTIGALKITDLDEKTVDAFDRLIKYAIDNKDLPEKELNSAVEKFIQRERTLETLFKPEIQIKVAEIIKSTVNEVLNKPLSANEIPEQDNIFKQIIDKTVNTGKGSAIIKRFFEDAAIDLKPDTDIPSETKRVFKKIYDSLETVKNNLSSDTTGKEIASKIESLQNDLKFFSDLYRYSSYLQMPISIFGKELTGELYILKKSRSRKTIDPENISAFLSLDTQNMGRFEAMVSLKKKDISINVILEDDMTVDYFKENFKELYEKLQNKGYRLTDVRYRVTKEDTTLLNADKVFKSIQEIKKIDIKI